MRDAELSALERVDEIDAELKALKISPAKPKLGRRRPDFLPPYLRLVK